MILTMRCELKDYASMRVSVCVSCATLCPYSASLGLTWKSDCFQDTDLRLPFKCARVYLSPVYPSCVRIEVV